MFSLTKLQKSFLMHHHVSKSPPLIRFGIKMLGTIEIEKIERSLNRILHEEQIFGLHFSISEGNFFAHYAPPKPLVIFRHVLLDDLHLNWASSVKELSGELGRDMSLSSSPLLAAKICELPREYGVILIIAVSHIIFDASSVSIFLDKFVYNYENDSNILSSGVQGNISFPTMNPIRYEENSSDELPKNSSQNNISPILLPTDHVDSSVSRPDNFIQFKIDGELLALVKESAKKWQCSSFVAFLSVYGILLHRLCIVNHFKIGIPITTRDQNAQMKASIGCFVDFRVLELEVDGSSSFESHIGSIRKNLIKCIGTRSIANKDLNQTTLVEVSIGHQKETFPSYQLAGLRIECIPLPEPLAGLDIHLDILEEKESAELILQYDTNKFSSERMTQFLEIYSSFLRECCLNSSKTISEIPLNSKVPDIHVRRNSAPSDFRLDMTMLERHSSRVAVIDNQIKYTYADVLKRCKDLAEKIVQNGDLTGLRIAILLPPGLDAIIALLTAILNGAQVFPINYMSFPTMVRDIVAFAPPKLFITNTALLNYHSLSSKDAILVDNLEQFYSSNSAATANPDIDASMLIPTSGTTGKSKLVKLNRFSLQNYIEHAPQFMGVNERDVWLQTSPLGSDFALEEILVPLSIGATLVCRSELSLASVEEFFKICTENEVSVLDIPTYYWHLICAAIEDEKLTIPSSLTTVIIGGELPTLRHIKSFLGIVPNAKIINTYGPSETTIACAAYRLDSENVRNLSLKQFVPIGQPIAGMSLMVVDDCGNEVVDGYWGELWISGPGVMSEYLGNPIQTKAVQRFARGEDQRVWYASGDRARKNYLGDFEVTGRFDSQIKVKGYRVDLDAIGTILLEHPIVKDCAAIPIFEEDDVAVGILIVPRGSNLLETQANVALTEDLMRMLAAKMPASTAPKKIAYLQEIPRTITGKIQREKLQSVLLSAIDKSGNESRSLTRDEQIVQMVWQKSLQVTEIGIDDDFFESGGDSLSAMNVTMELLDKGYQLDFLDIFKNRTIKTLVAVLRGNE